MINDKQPYIEVELLHFVLVFKIFFINFIQIKQCNSCWNPFYITKKKQQQQVFCILQPIGASCLSSEWNFFFHEWRGGNTYMQDGLQKKAKDLLLFVSCFFSRFEKILNSNNDDNDQVRSPSNPVSKQPLLCLSDLKGPPSVFFAGWREAYKWFSPTRKKC